MSRLLFWLALAFLVLFAIRSKLRELQGGQRPRTPHDQRPPERPAARPAGRGRASADVETMLCCAHCGIYYPASETVQAGGRDYCCAAHASLPAA
ncbi:MAG TPA: PP0621 family protein [Burkholderiaceae bacterium]|nr:PP0621 family protein [Burkholderiaceae bacterium]